MQAQGQFGPGFSRDRRAGLASERAHFRARLQGISGARMRNLMLGLIVSAIAPAAAAQDFAEGLYDGRDVAGWAYSQSGSLGSGLATWIPVSGGSEVDGANCNVGMAEVQGSRADYLEYFNAVTPEIFADQMRSAGTVVRAGHLTEVIDLDGRPAMRNILTAEVGDQAFNFAIVSIATEGRLVTLTCTVLDGGYLNRMQEFYDFAEGLTVLASPPR